MSAKIQQIYSSLEFDRLLDKIGGYASSELGKELVGKLLPFTEIDPLSVRLDEVSQLMSIIKYDDPFPIHTIHDIRNILEKVIIEGSILDIEEIINLAKTLNVSQALHRYLLARQTKYPALVPHSKGLHSFVETTREISKTIDLSTKEIKDSASPELAHIRKTLRRNQERVRKRLGELVEKFKDYLQDQIITLREGRSVIPLREDCKGKIKGFIHDKSSSGATLFIEPMEIFELNNQIREMQIEERREIERLLRQLTDLVRLDADEVNESFEILCQLDLLYAISSFGAEWGCSVPKYKEGGLEIIKCYHPLLLMKQKNRDKVIPLDVKMEKKSHLLIITGPNAGGKTVSLKTIGLSSLMFKCGIPVAADELSSFPLFDQIFVDIGDLQSIEQDLSTFSAHVGRLAEILNEATPDSLVLIDEIGTGTDPAEGSALAMSFLESLYERKTLTVVTTHQGVLKTFAHKLDGAENASMAFDHQTLQPTYIFRVGIPGSSYAFEIARRLGIPEQVVNKARKLIGTAHDKLEKFILELEQKLNRYQQLLSKAEIKETELEGLKKLYTERYEKLKKEEKQLKRKAVEESKLILNRANTVIEEAVKEIRTGQAAKQSIKNARSRVESVKKELEEQIPDVTKPEVLSENLPANGDKAYWHEMNVTGRVVSDPDNSGNVWLEAGDLKLHLPLNSLRLVEEKEDKAGMRLCRESVGVPEDLKTEIDIRGLTMDEAQPVLEKYLDQAYLSGLNQVRVIHGKGTGALRKKVNEYLKSYPKIENTSFAPWNEGDVGVTVVKFKS